MVHSEYIIFCERCSIPLGLLNLDFDNDRTETKCVCNNDISYKLHFVFDKAKS
jgi:hypothetical protein